MRGMHARIALLIALSFALAACPSGEAPAPLPTLDPPRAGSGFQMTLLDVVVEPGTEVQVCDVYDLPTEQISYVNRVEYIQNPGMHHATLSTVALSGHELPEGRHDCSDIYSDLAVMEDQVMFFGNQGLGEDTMQLPDGIAATLPAGMQILHELHYVNVSDEPVELYSYINAYTIPEVLVESGIWGGSVRDEFINIPPESEHTEWTRCVFNRDVEVLFLASHTHDLGTLFTVAPFDGVETVGEIFYANDDLHTPKIVQYDPPLVIPEGEGFEWACTWRNDSHEAVEYGPSALDEMCNLSVVHTPFDLGARCEVVESSDGVLWEGR